MEGNDFTVILFSYRWKIFLYQPIYIQTIWATILRANCFVPEWTIDIRMCLVCNEWTVLLLQNKYILDLCLIVLNMSSIASKRLSGEEWKMELSLEQGNDYSSLIHWCPGPSRGKQNECLERKIYYKMMATSRQISKLHVPAGCMKEWWLYEPQGFCFYFVNTGWQDPQPSQWNPVNRRGIC